MSEDMGVSRKNLKEDRIAICPKYGCEYMTRVKPLKFRFLGFGKHPKCKKHHLSLVYVDDVIEDFIDGALACFFDKSALPPSELIEEIRVKFTEEIESFVRGWVYCITTGRGASIVSRYIDGISNGYLKQLSRKQKKVLKKGDDGNADKISKGIRDGLKEITNQYTRLLKHLRIHSEILSDQKDLKPLSKSLRNYLNDWQKGILKNNEVLNKSKYLREMSLNEIKSNYDQILNIGTCRCLIGQNPESREIQKAGVSAFDRFSTYFDFYKEGLTEKFTKSRLTSITKIENHQQQINTKDAEYYEELKNFSVNKNQMIENESKENDSNRESNKIKVGNLPQEFVIDIETAQNSELYEQLFNQSLKSQFSGKSKYEVGLMCQNQNKRMRLLTKKDVNLKGYRYMRNKILRDFEDESILAKMIEYADIVLRNCIQTGNLPLYKTPQKLIQNHQKRVDVYEGKDYITRKDDYYGFVKKYREYKALVYLIRCKDNFPDNWFKNKKYFGYTHSTEKIRFRNHIQEAIEQYNDYQKGCRNEIPTKLNRSIIIAIEDLGYSISEIDDFSYFENEYSRNRMLEKLSDELEDFYFDVLDLACHKNLETAIKQEIKLIHKYNTTLELNVRGGGQGGLPYIPLPFYDIVGMIAIGCSQKKIWKFLNKLYSNDFINNNIAENTLRRRIIEEFLDWVNAQKLFLKPVVEALVYEGFSYQKIYSIFSSPHSKEGWIYKWWKKEEKLNFKFWLRLKILDVNKIRLILRDLEEKYCGIPKSQWVEWVKKEIPNNKIAEISGLPFNTIVSVYKHNFGGRNEILFEYKRDITIKKRREGMSLKNIYTSIFKKNYNSSNFKRDFITWFKGMAPKEIEETWGPDKD